MIDGYREDPEQANRRRDERRILIVSVAMAFTVMEGIYFFEDTLIASLGLTKSGFWWVSHVAPFVVLIAVQQLLQQRSIRRLQPPIN